MPTTRPLNPPASEAEKDRAAALWTAANDDLVERGYTRHLWGCMREPAREMVYLIIRQAVAIEREACAELCEKSDRHRGDYFAQKILERSTDVTSTPNDGEARAGKPNTKTCHGPEAKP